MFGIKHTNSLEVSCQKTTIFEQF
ncbi:hypothetical protein EE612_054315 [Oryza sativa]|nr:hypothetical protein EE612_054315 [Oryza sativa]